MPNERSWSRRVAARGGSTFFSDLGPPPAAAPEQLLTWAQESHRRNVLVIDACQSALLDGREAFYHPLTGKLSDIALHLPCAQQRLKAAIQYMRDARAPLPPEIPASA